MLAPAQLSCVSLLKCNHQFHRPSAENLRSGVETADTRTVPGQGRAMRCHTSRDSSGGTGSRGLQKSGRRSDQTPDSAGKLAALRICCGRSLSYVHRACLLTDANLDRRSHSFELSAPQCSHTRSYAIWCMEARASADCGSDNGKLCQRK
jgi:hypothetical protein